MRSHLLIAIIAVIVGSIDQFIKAYFLRHFMPGQSIPVFPGVFHLTHVQNTGAAFGILTGARLFLIGISAIVLLGILGYTVLRRPRALWLQAGFGFIVGGSSSNLYDRIFRGYVLDYLDFRVWPVFNVADTMINVGVGMIVLYMLFHRREAV